MKQRHLLSIGALLVAGALSPPALAFDCHATGGQQITDWANSGETCSWQGLTYSLLFYSPALGNVYVYTKDEAGDDQLNFSSWTIAKPATGFPYELRYSVEIDLTARPNSQFATADLTSDVLKRGGTTAMTTTFYQDANRTMKLGDTLTSSNGGASDTNTAIAGLTKLWVVSTFYWTGTGTQTAIVNSVTNHLSTAEAPEPATLALLGLGFAGLSARSRRVRKGWRIG